MALALGCRSTERLETSRSRTVSGLLSVSVISRSLSLCRDYPSLTLVLLSLPPKMMDFTPMPFCHRSEMRDRIMIRQQLSHSGHCVIKSLRISIVCLLNHFSRLTAIDVTLLNAGGDGGRCCG